MNIPYNLCPLGVENLPSGYTSLEFLESTGYKNSSNLNFPYLKMTMPEVADSDIWEFATVHALDFSTGLAQVEGLNAAGTAEAMFYGATKAQKLYAGSGNGVSTVTDVTVDTRKHTFAFRQKGQSSYLVFDGEEFALSANTAQFPSQIGIFAALKMGNVGFYYPFNGKKFRWQFRKNGTVVRDLLPALDPTGTPCMVDLVSRTAFYNAGTGAFIAGVGTPGQLLGLLQRLPATGGELTLSLPAEANTPEVAEALQACHDTKGWTLTVHEYRAAAVATYSLRRVRTVVWCRKLQAEHGCYVATDGTRWQVESCAAIYGPLGTDPAAYGYAPFDSVEQAAEAWGLVAYVEEESTF